VLETIALYPLRPVSEARARASDVAEAPCPTGQFVVVKVTVFVMISIADLDLLGQEGTEEGQPVTVKIDVARTVNVVEISEGAL